MRMSLGVRMRMGMRMRIRLRVQVRLRIRIRVRTRIRIRTKVRKSKFHYDMTNDGLAHSKLVYQFDCDHNKRQRG